MICLSIRYLEDLMSFELVSGLKVNMWKVWDYSCGRGGWYRFVSSGLTSKVGSLSSPYFNILLGWSLMWFGIRVFRCVLWDWRGSICRKRQGWLLFGALFLACLRTLFIFPIPILVANSYKSCREISFGGAGPCRWFMCCMGGALEGYYKRTGRVLLGILEWR